MNIIDMFVHKSTRAIWGECGWAFLDGAPCKDGKVWIIADPKSDKWDLVRWDGERWDRERGVDFSKVLHPICKPLDISK
jgi:hypothetical protein